MGAEEQIELKYIKEAVERIESKLDSREQAHNDLTIQMELLKRDCENCRRTTIEDVTALKKKQSTIGKDAITWIMLIVSLILSLSALGDKLGWFK